MTVEDKKRMKNNKATKRKSEAAVCSSDLLGDWGDELFTMDGYDDCIAGVVEQFGRPPIVCYDKRKVLAKLQKDGMSEDEAEEFWSFNQIGAWVGESTPCFLTAQHQAIRPSLRSSD